jgi:hypothetical protein
MGKASCAYKTDESDSWFFLWVISAVTKSSEASTKTHNTTLKPKNKLKIFVRMLRISNG